LQDRHHVRIALGDAPRAPGHGERGELGVLQRDVLHAAEEAEILGIRAGPAALDVVDAEGVETARQAHLVLHGEGHALALSAVTQRRVVNPDETAHFRSFASLPEVPHHPLAARGVSRMPSPCHSLMAARPALPVKCATSLAASVAWKMRGGAPEEGPYER